MPCGAAKRKRGEGEKNFVTKNTLSQCVVASLLLNPTEKLPPGKKPRRWWCFFCFFLSVHFSPTVSNSVTPRTRARQASLSITNSWSLLKLMSIELLIHPIVSSSVIPFSSWFQSFPASGSFPGSQFFTSGGQSIGISASALVLLMNIQH